MVVAGAPMNTQGRVVIPAAIRKAMGLDGTVDLVFRYEDNILTVETIGDAVAAVQEIVAGYVPTTGSHVDDFIADRRTAAARE